MGGDEPRHQIEWKDAFLASLVSVDVERDPHVHQIALGYPLPAQELPLRQGINSLHQHAKLLPRSFGRAEKLVIEIAGLIGAEVHGRFLTGLSPRPWGRRISPGATFDEPTMGRFAASWSPLEVCASPRRILRLAKGST